MLIRCACSSRCSRSSNVFRWGRRRRRFAERFTAGTKYPRLGVIIDFITRPGCASASRDRVNRKSANAISRLRVVFHSPGRIDSAALARVLFAHVRAPLPPRPTDVAARSAPLRSAPLRSADNTSARLEHAVVSRLLRLRLCRRARMLLISTVVARGEPDTVAPRFAQRLTFLHDPLLFIRGKFAEFSGRRMSRVCVCV